MEDTYAFVPPNPGDLANMKRKRRALENHQRKRADTISHIARCKEKAKFDAWLRQLELPKEDVPSQNMQFLLELNKPKIPTNESGEFSEVYQRLEAHRKEHDDRLEAHVKKLEMNCLKRQDEQRPENSLSELSPAERLKAWKEKIANTIEVAGENNNLSNKASCGKSCISTGPVSIVEDPKNDDVLKIMGGIIEKEKRRRINLNSANYTTEQLKDADCFKQPANVFERMWTPICSDNPVYMNYVKMIGDYKTKAIDKNLQLAACSQCMTFFYPSFPADLHLHTPSEGIRSALNKKKIRAYTGLVSDDTEDQKIPEIICREALLILAKEAKAYKLENGFEYIKLVRIAEGMRKNSGGAKYGRFELCENHNSGSDVVENTPKVFETKSLAAGIFEIICR
jgi:hypothetical protein